MFRREKSRVESRESREKTWRRGDSRLSTLDSRLFPRRGITLIELLVVITILAMLAAITIPRMRPMMENRNVRESARALNVFLSRARVQAIETGRHCGVLFERANALGAPNACVVMRQVEIPPPYMGDTIQTMLRLHVLNADPSTGLVDIQANLASGSSFSGGLVRVGDLVQINHQGPWYRITAANNVDANGYILATPAVAPDPPGLPMTLSVNVGPRGAVPWPKDDAAGNPLFSAPMPFAVYRQPIDDMTFGSIAPSLQLPRGTVVDLEYSGVGTGTEFAPLSTTDVSPVVVMFSPSGALDRVYIQGEGVQVTEPVFLLVGRWERTLDPLPDDGFNNWQDMTNFWLAVTPQTGLITAAEPGDQSSVNASRNLVREAQISKGGR